MLPDPIFKNVLSENSPQLPDIVRTVLAAYALRLENRNLPGSHLMHVKSGLHCLFYIDHIVCRRYWLFDHSIFLGGLSGPTDKQTVSEII